MNTPADDTVWMNLGAGQYATVDGWNVWRRNNRIWYVRTPRGEYHTVGTLREGRELVDNARNPQ